MVLAGVSSINVNWRNKDYPVPGWIRPQSISFDFGLYNLRQKVQHQSVSLHACSE